ARFEGLPLDSQPEHIWVRDEPLPRLSSGHLNRERLARQVQRHRTALMAQANTHTEVAPKLLATIRHSFQEVIGTKLELSLRTSLRIDLPLDALQELRVVEALEHDLQRTLDHALFLQCDTISDVVVWLHSRV